MSATATRRGFLAGAAASVTAPALLGTGTAAGASGTPRASAVPVHRGRALAVGARGRCVVVAHDGRRTIGVAGRHPAIDVEGAANAVAVTADGALAAVTTASWDVPGLAFVDPVAGRLLQRLEAGPAPGAVAFTADGKRLVLLGGEQEGTITVVDVARRAVLRTAEIGRVPRGLALTPDGRTAYIALQADDHVVAVDLRTGKVRRDLAVPTLPDRVALHPQGRQLLLTHADDRVTVLDLRTGKARRKVAGRHPSGVAYAADGRPLVALGGESSVLDLRRGRRRAAGTAPRGLVVVGRRCFTVSALTGAVTKGRA